MVAPTTRIVRSMLPPQRPPFRFERATVLTLPAALEQDNTLLVAILALAQQVARFLEVDPSVPIAEAARMHRVSRPYVYELVMRIVAVLEPLAEASCGRPPRPSVSTSEPRLDDLVFANAALRFRLDHPGAVSMGETGHRSYAPVFRRFILGLVDRWPADRNRADLARAVDVPLDTLHDWIESDQNGLTPPVPDLPAVLVPRDASQAVVDIADLYARWHGSLRDFLRDARGRLGLRPGQVLRVLCLLGLVPLRRPAPLPRYRGSTHTLHPGALLVTDGKTLDIELTASGTSDTRTWQAVVDQATACHTGSAIRANEDAPGVWLAFSESLAFLGGKRPDGLLHDRKPVYQDADLRARVAPTLLVPATPARGENKAILEGTFGRFAQQIGTIRLDDADRDRLITSAVHEVVRGWTSAVNHTPHADLDGKSRAQALHDACPSPEQAARDARFIRQLKQRHEHPPRPQVHAASRALADDAFARWAFAAKDRDGALRRYLSTFSPDALRRAIAIFASRLERNRVRRDHAHRYFVRLVQTCQDEVDLELQATELLALNRRCAQVWTAAEEADLAAMREQLRDPLALAQGIAERAALAGLPVETAFWDPALRDHLRAAPALLEPVRRFLVRLFEAPVERRLSLLDQLAAVEVGLN